jgi:hypothetical protein
MGPVNVPRLQLIVEVASAPSDELDRVLRIARELGLDLRPQHPAAEEPDLRRFLVAFVPDLGTGQEAAERLSSVAGVRAYVKPPAALA